MNTTPPLQTTSEFPTAAQLFGSNYKEEYLRNLPEHVQFSQPIVPRLDIGRTKRITMRFVEEYDMKLIEKYPQPEGKKGNPEYSSHRLNSGSLATLDAMFEMYAGYLNAIKDGSTPKYFSVSPSGIASRRYKSVRSMNTIGEHLERLEAAELFKSTYDAKKQKYNITWNTSILVAHTDKQYRTELAKMIVEKAPELKQSEEFNEWVKRLNPSFFACSSPLSPQFLSMYLLFKQEQNINTHKRKEVNGGNKVSPKPPSEQEQGNSNINKIMAMHTNSLGAEKISSNEITQKKTFARLIGAFSSEQNLQKKDEKKEKQIDYSELNSCVNSAFFLAIGIFNNWWHDKIISGAMPDRDIELAKLHIRWLLLNQPGYKPKIEYREYISKVFLPVIRCNRNATLKYDYGWIPYLGKYFDPQWMTNDGMPAGYIRAQAKWEELELQGAKRKTERDLKKKIKKQMECREIMFREYRVILRKPSERNYVKSETKIRKLHNKHLLHEFFFSVSAANILSKEFMRNRRMYVQN